MTLRKRNHYSPPFKASERKSKNQRVIYSFKGLSQQCVSPDCSAFSPCAMLCGPPAHIHLILFILTLWHSGRTAFYPYKCSWKMKLAFTPDFISKVPTWPSRLIYIHREHLCLYKREHFYAKMHLKLPLLTSIPQNWLSTLTNSSFIFFTQFFSPEVVQRSTKLGWRISYCEILRNPLSIIQTKHHSLSAVNSDAT